MEKEKLLEKIRHDFSKLGVMFDDRNISLIDSPDHEVLRDRNILMIDSDEKALGVFIVGLNLATQGKAFFFDYKKGSKENLLEFIDNEKIEIILISDKLLSSIDGVALTKFLRKQKPKAKIVGLWTEEIYKEIFRRTGIMGSVAKNVGFPNTLIDNLVELLKEKLLIDR